METLAFEVRIREYNRPKDRFEVSFWYYTDNRYDTVSDRIDIVEILNWLKNNKTLVSNDK